MGNSSVFFSAPYTRFKSTHTYYVPCERKVVKLVDKLKDSENPSGTASVLDRHRQHRRVLERGVPVHVPVEPDR